MPGENIAIGAIIVGAALSSLISDLISEGKVAERTIQYAKNSRYVKSGLVSKGGAYHPSFKVVGGR